MSNAAIHVRRGDKIQEAYFYDIDKYIEIEKAEAKYRRSHEEYKTSVALFGNARDDFERKMTLATRRFQVTSLTTQNSVTKLLFLSNLL